MTATGSGRDGKPSGSRPSDGAQEVSTLSGFDPSREVEPYENTLSIEELRRELRECWDIDAAFTRDLRDLPEAPSVETMRLLSSAAMNIKANLWERGKEMQRRLRETTRKEIDGLDGMSSAIPYKCEYECGAGLWSIIRAAIAMETGTAIDSEAGVVAKP